MIRYLLKRVLFALMTFIVLVTVTFLLMQALPGNPLTGDKKLPDSVMENMRAKYGLDKPVSEQYLVFWRNILSGDFGNSLQYTDRPIMKMLAQAFPYSIKLGFWSLLYSTIAGLILGILAALNPGKTIDGFAMVVAVIGISIPSFVLATMLQYLISLKLGNLTLAWFGWRILPIGGWGTVKHLILPVFVSGLGNLAGLARSMRASMIDETMKDYVKTAQSKGVPGKRIVTNHLLRNSLLPIVTNFGGMIASLFSGSFIVEKIFNVPGIGKLFVDCVMAYDYPMIMANVVIFGALMIACNLIVDILYGLVDPRIRLDRKMA